MYRVPYSHRLSCLTVARLYLREYWLTWGWSHFLTWVMSMITIGFEERWLNLVHNEILKDPMYFYFCDVMVVTVTLLYIFLPLPILIINCCRTLTFSVINYYFFLLDFFTVVFFIYINIAWMGMSLQVLSRSEAQPRLEMIQQYKVASTKCNVLYTVLAGLALLDDVRIFYGRHMEKVRVWRAADEEEAADREGDSNLRDMPTDTVRSRTMVSGLYGGIETGTAG
ncbi:hypothetical protein GGS26DRAFT_553333 [Hypomontagnella submonticulosa]|nr:hypothetical protein GGS26DRAFT_553333 [Hypomontagnella submonticulosa]